jgi:RNA polymerase sigma-70 factor (ECF subfamily)
VEEKLAALRDEHGAAVERYLLNFTGGNRTETEDLLQETMIRAWRNLDRMPPEGEQTRRWLFTVARNVGIDAVRAKKVRPAEVELIEASSVAHSDETMETVVALHSLSHAVNSLSSQHRAVVHELYVQGRSVAETARRLGLPVGTVKSRAHYAMRTLRRAIDSPV